VGECINLAVAPINLTVTSSNTEVTELDLEWEDALGSTLPTTQYEVYQSGTELGLYALISSQAGTTLTVANLQQNESYWFKVRSINSLSTSPPSEAVGAVTGAIAPTPINVDATPLLTIPASIALTWDEGTEYTPVATLYYNIFTSLSIGGTKTLQGTSATTDFIIDDLSENTTYFLWVQAVNSLAVSPVSSTLTQITYPLVSKPISFVADALPSEVPSIQLTWEKGIGTSPEELQYDVYRLEGASSVGIYTLIESTYNTEVVDSGLEPTTQYWYYLIARDSSNTSEETSKITETTFNEYNGNQMGDNQMGDEQLGGRTL
jgi:predicted phage tail protein